MVISNFLEKINFILTSDMVIFNFNKLKNSVFLR